jgi:hypothetical protein
LKRRKVKTMENEEWVKIQRDYLEKQAPLRAAWINGDEEAGKELKKLVAETEAECPPITGAFTYINCWTKEAKKHGF